MTNNHTKHDSDSRYQSIGALPTTGDITCSNATATTITANKSSRYQQTGDLYGTSRMMLQTRDAVNGGVFQTTNPTTTLTYSIL